ncbi:MAG: hypothetical protein PHX13_10545, partial [Thiovulaceae bacterium]|nr:hypothetical protein [Sulfurimonadaceae bacterium]
GYYLAGQQYYFQRFNGYCSAIDPYVSRAKDGSLSVYYCIGGSEYLDYFLGSTPVSGCPSGTVLDSNNTCSVPTLSSYDKDPQGCDKAGGYYYSSGVSQVGGTEFGSSFFGGSGLFVGGNMVMNTHCGTLGDVVGQVTASAIGMLPLASKLFGSLGLKKYAVGAYLRKLAALPDLLPPPKNLADMYVGMPRLPAPNSSGVVPPASTPIVPIVETPVPTSPNSSGVVGPSRAPIITPDPNYVSVPDTYIPTDAQSNPVVDYSVVDRFNTFAKVVAQPQLADIVPQVGSYTMPVKETFDFSSMVQGSPSPSTVAVVPVTTTKTVSYSGTDPVDIFTTIKSYPDGSSSSQVVSINTISRYGTITDTSLSSVGQSYTLSLPFSMSSYQTNSFGVGTGTITPPTGQTFAPISDPVGSSSAVPVTSSALPSSSQLNSSNQISGQDPATIINAQMPSYSFPKLSDMTLFSVDSINQLNSNFSDLFNNINNQIGTVGTTFDTTKALISGSWQPPVIPAGSCGNFMAFDFHNNHVDLCPPMAQQTAKIAPLITLLLTIAGSVLAVRIYLNALRD